jgi:hypothetical protein
MVYRYEEQYTPPEATQVTDVAITRYEDVYEVDPGLMAEHVNQQTFPNWDTLRIVRSRHDHLQWMHDHWAHTVISGEEVLRSLDEEAGS